MDKKEHWEEVYNKKTPEEVSWFQAEASPSIEWIVEAFPQKDATVIDVGGGTSNLASNLLVEGFVRPAVLDIASAAIEKSKSRLGERARDVEWLVEDVSLLKSDHKYDLWHDRAVFHFLVNGNDRRKYVEAVLRNLSLEGKVLIATFSPKGPTQCSGLDVMRFDAEALAFELGNHFKLIKSADICHKTPKGFEQHFTYCLFSRVKIMPLME